MVIRREKNFNYKTPQMQKLTNSEPMPETTYAKHVIFVATQITTQEVALKGDRKKNQQTPYQNARKKRVKSTQYEEQPRETKNADK